MQMRPAPTTSNVQAGHFWSYLIRSFPEMLDFLGELFHNQLLPQACHHCLRCMKTHGENVG
eukprot:1143672-Pelagomonas_calceolata.AAC.9